MPPPPPLKDVLDALQQDVLPGAGGAALVMCLFLLLGRWSAALGSAVAIAVAFMWSNFLPGSDPPDWENTSRLLHWKPDKDEPGYQWLPRAALLLVLVGLVSRWVGLLAAHFLPARFWWGSHVLVWLPRIVAVGMVSAWLVLGNAAEAPVWAHLRWELIAAMLLVWFVLDALARSEISSQLAVYLAAIFYAGAAVLLYSHNGTFMELAVVIGSAMFGIAVAAGLAKTSADAKVYASGAIPAVAAFLPGLLLGTRPSHPDNKVPDICFWLVALAPLLLAPFLLPRVSRQNRWLLLVLRMLLVLTPLIVAVLLAGQHEKLPYEE